MDITQTSRAYFAMPSPTPSEKISLAASSTVYTYHCLCTHLLLATSTKLPELPTRKHSLDQAHIMPLPPPPAPASAVPQTTPAARVAARRASEIVPADHYGCLLSTRLDASPEMCTSDEGFEKRYLQRCGRCSLVVGYHLDWQHFSAERSGRRDDLVYLLPGGFVTTSEMISGKTNQASRQQQQQQQQQQQADKGGIGLVSVAEVKV